MHQQQTQGSLMVRIPHGYGVDNIINCMTFSRQQFNSIAFCGHSRDHFLCFTLDRLGPQPCRHDMPVTNFLSQRIGPPCLYPPAGVTWAIPAALMLGHLCSSHLCPVTTQVFRHCQRAVVCPMLAESNLGIYEKHSRTHGGPGSE